MVFHLNHDVDRFSEEFAALLTCFDKAESLSRVLTVDHRLFLCANANANALLTAVVPGDNFLRYVCFVDAHRCLDSNENGFLRGRRQCHVPPFRLGADWGEIHHRYLLERAGGNKFGFPR